jgi:preprotein translocase subunit SecG
MIGTMKIAEVVLGSIILLMAVVIVALVLCQSGKDKKLSGAIAGAAETFFAKGHSKKRDKILSAITTAMSCVLVVLVVVLYLYLA